MPNKTTKITLITAVIIAFLGGLIVASGMDWTRLGFAQNKPSSAEVQSLAETSNAFVSIADHVTPAVVSIRVAIKNNAAGRGTQRTIPRGMLPPGFEDFFNMQMPQQPPVIQGSGSGFIVSKDGYILTNNHVVTNQDQQTVADQVTVQLLNKHEYKARVVGHDPTTDVAVLKIEGNDFPTLQLGDDTKSRVGEWVLAIGNPLGLDFTVTAGIISAKGRGGNEVGLRGSGYSITDLIQTDAAINPGNSGGPLINARGEVIGINNSIATNTGYYSGYGFAIPITLARRVMNDLIAHGKVRAGALRIQIGEVAEEDAAVVGLKDIRGAKVGGFLPNSPAQGAGLAAGDVIVTADGQPIDRVSTLQRLIRNHAPGETIELEVMRYGGQRKIFRVKLVEMELDGTPVASTTPSPASSGETAAANSKLGVRVTTLPAEMAAQAKIPADRRGVLVSDVTALGPAYGKIVPQDIIFEVLYPARQTVRSPADLQAAVAKLKSGDLISLNVYNAQDGGSRVVNMRVGE